MVVGTGLLGSLTMGADSVFDITTAYAEETEGEDKESAEEGTEEGEDEEGKKDSTVGSSGDNPMNVLSETKTENTAYMKNLDSVLGYNKGTHYLMTLSVLNSQVMTPDNYAKVYTGTYKPEGVPEDISKIDTNTAGLYDKLARIELEEEEENKQEGVTDAQVEEIFGKKRAELTKEEKKSLETLEKMVEDEGERDKQKTDFDTKAVSGVAHYLCTTAYFSTGYGGAGFSLPESGDKEGEIELGETSFVHNIETTDSTSGATTKDAKDPCVKNLEKMHGKKTKQTNSLVTGVANNLSKHGRTYSSDLATDAINSVREPDGTLSGSYPELDSKVSSSVGASKILSQVKTDSTLTNLGIKLLAYYASVLEWLNLSPTINNNVHYMLGNGEDDDEKYRNVGMDTRTDFVKTVIPKMNEVYGTSYDKGSFLLTGTKGNYEFDKGAFDTLNDFLTINLISSSKYFMGGSSKELQKQVYYSEHVAPLADHPYLLFKKYDKIGKEAHSSVANIKGLGWVPFYYIKDINESVEESKYTKLMKDHDGTTIPKEGRFLGNEDGARVVKVRDIVANEGGMDTLSPLSAKDMEAKVEPFTSGLGRQDSNTMNPSGYSGLKLSEGKVVAKTEEDLTSTRFGAYQKAYSNADAVNTYTGQEAIGIDNYGNMIVGNGLSVVVPYWHMFKSGNDIFSTPLFKTVDEVHRDSGRNYIDTKSAEGEGSYAFFDKRKQDLNTAYADTSINTTDAIKTAIKEGEGYEPQLRQLAYRIVDYTENNVKDYNEQFIKSYNEAYEEGHGELYVTSATLNEGESSEMDKLHDEFTEADIIHKIAMMLKYGASDFIRLTFVGFFVNFYNTTVYNFTISEVFYSTTIVDSGFFKGLLPNITVLIGAITALYWGYSVFNMWRERITVKRFVGVTVALTFVLIIPFLYAIIIDKGMNEVSDKLLGKQTRQMMVVDSWTRAIENKATEGGSDSRLYGYNNEIEFRDTGQDYILDFATTTAIENGCDVVNPEDIYCEEFVYENNTTNVRTDWESSDLVTVSVSLYDVLEWMDEISEGKEQDLFTYLVGRADAADKGYDALSDYSEYSLDTSVILENVGLGQSTFTGEVISASELLKRVHLNANEGDQLIKTLSELTVVYDELLKNPEVTNEEVSYVIRDVSMTRKSRQALNLGEDKMSPVTETIASKASIKITPPGEGLDNHSGDLFNLYDSIEKLDPHRVPGYKKQLEEDIYRLNKETVENYFADFALVRKAIGGDTDPSYKRTEANIMSTVLWFNLNDYFGFSVFPKEYSGSSVSLDNYMRVAYVPIGVFSDPTVSASGEYGYTNVGEYLSLRENMFNLLVFALSILMMIGYGLIKYAIIHVVLLLLTIYAFVKNYVVEYNPDNKFGFGAFVMYGTFIVVNIIFNAMWWIFGYAINNSYVANDGAVGYPAVVIHSVITIAVLAFIIFFVFKKLFKNVRGDMANMGGNNFKKGFDKMRGRIKGMMRGNMTSTENNNESAYMEESKREGGQGEITKDEVKRSNDLGERNLKSVINDDSITTSNFIMSELDDSKNASNNPDSAYAKMKGMLNMRAPKGKALANTLSEYDSINTSNNSLISEEDKERYDELGNFGAKLSESGTGNSISMLGFGATSSGVAQAKLFSDYLSKKGIKSTLDSSGQVMFDSGKYNMSTKEGRKTLLDGFIQKTANDALDNKTLERFDVNNSSNLSNNLDYNMDEDGNVDINVGGASGINPSVLAGMITQDWFRDRFQVEQPYTGKGAEGNIVLKPKTENAEDIDRHVTDLFKEDTKIRDREGMEERADSNKNLKVLSFNGKNKAVTDLIRKEFESQGGAKSGAKLHANSIAFDGSNKEHRKMVKGIENMMKEKNVSDTRTAEQIASKVANFTIHGQGTQDNEELNAFQRMTNKTKDATGNAMFNISNAKDEAKNKVLGMVTISGMARDKSEEGVSKQAQATVDELRDLDNLDEEELENNLKKKSSMSQVFGARNKVREDVGNQKHSAETIGKSDKSYGAGMMFGKLDTKDENVRKLVAENGLIGDKVSTTIYGGDDFGKKIDSFNKIANIVETNKEDVELLSRSKDDLLDVVNTRIGNVGSESRAKALMDYIGSTSSSDPEFYRSVRTMYDKLNDDFNSGNIESNRYKSGLKRVTNEVESMLKGQSKYDNALIQVLNRMDNVGADGDKSQQLTDSERTTMENYRKSKAALVDKNFDSKIIEKFDGRTFNKMMAFVEQGNKVEVNEEGTTFDVQSTESLNDGDTKDIYKMINDIA